jgi:choline dehydrogenase-like flavoprotein
MRGHPYRYGIQPDRPGQELRPSSPDRRASSSFEWTPSLVYGRARWLSTVRSLMNSAGGEGRRALSGYREGDDLALPAVQRLLLQEETVSSDDALAAYVRATVSTQFHPCGTARIGPPGDPIAVVGQHCRVPAIPGLRVADASVMPAIPPSNINLTCIMIGEHVSDWIRGET